MRMRKGIALLQRPMCKAIFLTLLASNGVFAQSALGSSGRLVLRQLDVDQGDAALITTPEGKTILIDAGHKPGEVAEVIRAAGIDTIDLVVASHAHADHLGGMPVVLNAFVVRAYMDNGIPYTTGLYSQTLSELESLPRLQYLQASRRTISLGSVTIRVLPPPNHGDSQNNNSVGLLIEFGNFRALYTGDSEREELSSWLQTENIPRVTVLKAAHHGSCDGLTEEWAQATSPAVVLISVGAHNGYGHPCPQVEQFWVASGARVLETDRVGEIDVIATRDGNYTIQTAATAGVPEPYKPQSRSRTRRR